MTSEHVYEATVTTAPSPTALEVVGGRISLDARRSPHVDATLRCVRGDAASLALLDPRSTPRVLIGVVATINGAIQSRTFDLGVRRRPIPVSENTYEIGLASDEELLQDYRPLADVDLSAFDGRDLVNEVLGTAIPGAALEPGLEFTVSVEAAEEAKIWKAGDSAEEFLRPIVQASGLRLVCDEQRRWTLRDEEYAAPGMLNVRHGINLMDGEDSIDRESGIWFDAAIARYRWRDIAGDQQEAVDSYAESSSYTRAQLFDFDTPYPGPGFAEYAVRRARGRGREVTFTIETDWNAQAEQTVFAVLDDMPFQVGSTQSITFDIDAEQMAGTTMTLEAPDTAYIFGPVGVAYEDVPEGIAYEEFDWSSL